MGNGNKHEKGNDDRFDIQNQSHIAHSGNSDVHVDITIEVDVTPIAFALLYSLFAEKKLSDTEFELAVKRLEAYKPKQEG